MSETDTSEAEGTDASTDGGAETAQPQGAVAGVDQRGVGDILGEDQTKTYAKYGAGVFGAAGIGLLLGLILFDSLVSDNFGGMLQGAFLGIGVLASLMATPILGAAFGVVTGLELDDTEKATAIVGGASTFVGYLAFYVLLIIAESVALSDSSMFTDELVAFLGFGVGVAAAGAVAAFATKKRAEW